MACLSIAMGATLTRQPGIGLMMLGALLAVTFASAPAGGWAAMALIAALTFKGLGSLGVLPSVATFLDIPLAWGALAVALLKRRPANRQGRSLLGWVGALALAIFLSWVIHPTEPARPILYLLLLGEPFALIAALVLDPPSARVRRALTRVIVLLALIQIPITALQFALLGRGDPLQGTLFGAGAGAHVISAVTMVSAIWILAQRGMRFGARLFAAVPLMMIPLLADAKQVVFAVPAAVLLIGRIGWRRRILLAAAGLVLFVGLFMFFPAAQTAARFTERAVTDRGGKVVTARRVFHQITSDLPSLVFGKGPAQTVSRAAFMTTDELLRSDSPLRVFGLRPARLAQQINAKAREASGGGSSFNTGLSSMIGVLGDIGLAGMMVYVGTVLAIALALRRRDSADAVAALSGWVLLFILGLVFDWWEQPPFSVFVAVLAGLALSDQAGERTRATEREASRTVA